MISPPRSKGAITKVENILGLLLCVCLVIWLTPWALENGQLCAVADVSRKLVSLEEAKARYFHAKGSANTVVGPVELVPDYLDRWPCSTIGQCSDFRGGDMREPASFRGVTLDELEDPVTYLESVKKLDVRHQDFLITQS